MLVGEPVHKALPTSIRMTAAFIEAFRPNTSAIWVQNGMNAADVRLKADTIQFCCEIFPKSLAIHGRALAMLCRAQLLAHL